MKNKQSEGMYFLSDINGRITGARTLYTAIRLLLIRGSCNGLDFGETIFIENERGILLYKLSWFETRPTKINQ